MTLYGRRCVVQVDQLRVEGLTVQFSVELDEKLFGKAEIKIFNLNEEHRKQFEDSKAVDVRLEAGYVDETLEIICQGTLREVFSEYNKPDWITTIRSGDGDKASPVRLNRSYPPGTPKTTLVQDLVGALESAGIGVGNAVRAFDQGDWAGGIKELLHGGTVQGGALGELKRLARDANLDVTIQEGELLVTDKGQPTQTTAVVLSPSTGLIGSPQPGTKGELKAKALLIPGLKPKRKVQIRSRHVDGLYQIQKVKYTGDTSGNDWYADLVCKAVQ